MANNYRYPADIDTEQPLSPELLKLWDEAMADLKKRRNFALLWQIPCVFLCPIFWILPVLQDWKYPQIPILVTPILIGNIGLGLVPSVLYWVSDDRSSAKIKLRHGFSWREMLEPTIFKPVREMKDGFGEFVIGVVLLAMSPFVILITGLRGLPEFFNKLMWLYQFRNLDSSIKDRSDPMDKNHIKGTNILPPAELSGTLPESDETMKVLGGKLLLHGNGGLTVEGGSSFDLNSTFENFSKGELILTRTDPGLLRVRYDNKNYAFFYNGSNWSGV